jgi:hypothetical protein
MRRDPSEERERAMLGSDFKPHVLAYDPLVEVRGIWEGTWTNYLKRENIY